MKFNLKLEYINSAAERSKRLLWSRRWRQVVCIKTQRNEQKRAKSLSTLKLGICPAANLVGSHLTEPLREARCVHLDTRRFQTYGCTELLRRRHLETSQCQGKTQQYGVIKVTIMA
jgi:hypothetical protein